METSTTTSRNSFFFNSIKLISQKPAANNYYFVFPWSVFSFQDLLY